MIKIPEELKDLRFIRTNEKIPIEKEWVLKNNYNYEEMNKILENCQTYGVLGGYNDLLVVDFDDAIVQAKVLSSNPLFLNTFAVKTAGKGLGHFYFYVDEPPESFKCKTKDERTFIDAQGIGKQVIGPNSILNNGKKYEVINPLPIKKVSYSELRAFLKVFDESNPIQDKKDKGEYKPVINSLNDEIKEKIKDLLPIKDILKDCGIETKKNPTKCPFHESIKGSCFSFTDKLWHCFHCDRSGDLFTLYQEIHKVDFPKALEDLKKRCGLKEKEVKNKDEEEDKSKTEYSSIKIEKFTIYKNKDETLYKIKIGDTNMTLNADEILNPNSFRKKYLCECGTLLPPIKLFNWAIIINLWIEQFGEFIEDNIEDNTKKFIVETVINDIKNFAVVDQPEDAISYGRVYLDPIDTDFVYVCNKVLDSLIRKHNFKIPIGELRYLLDDFISGGSKVIRTKKTTNRFLRFKRLELGMEIIEEKVRKDDTEEDD